MELGLIVGLGAATAGLNLLHNLRKHRRALDQQKSASTPQAAFQLVKPLLRVIELLFHCRATTADASPAAN